MEHYKSTLGTTAAAISALVLAAQIMQTGPFAASPPRAERVSAAIEASAQDTAWVNPPVRPLAEAKPETAPAEAKTGDAPVIVAQAAASVVAPLTGPAVVREAAPRKAAAPHRRKVAQRPVRTRQATLDARTPTEAATPQAAVQPAQPEAKRIDPIGDIIRGLGFGGQG